MPSINDEGLIDLPQDSSGISGDLLDLYEEFIEFFGEDEFPETEDFQSSNDLMTLSEDNTNVLVRVTTDNVESLLPALENLGFEVTATEPSLNFVEGFLPVTSIPQLESLETQGLLGVVPVLEPMTGIGSVTSQADFIHEADRVRASLPMGFNGAGSTIGVISNSYDQLNQAANDVLQGDLPGAGNPNGFTTPVNVLNDQTGLTASIDEGRAMLQLIHDLAPGAPLAFATGFGGESNFANNIRALANAGANIIVDDIFYFAEPLFQDGVIAQAIDDVVTNRGVSYFSLAGNLATQAYESTAFAGAPDSASILAGTFHDFNTDPNVVDTRQGITIGTGQRIDLLLQWDDPFRPFADTDLNVFLVQPGTGTVLQSALTTGAAQTPAQGTTRNFFNQPFEIISFFNTTGAPLQAEVVIQLAPLLSRPFSRVPSQAPGRIKYVNYGSNSFGAITFDEYATNSSTIIPHAAAVNARAVGAVNYFDQENPANFTSAGPNTILFSPNGTRLATPDMRQNPDFAAIQGTDTTFFAGDISGDGNTSPNFFGTSAAAPQAAAIAALIRQANPNFTSAQIYNRLQSTAKDIGAPGFDNLTGFGLINAYDAVFGPAVPASLPFTDGFETGVLSQNYETDTNGAGRIQVTGDNEPATGARHVILDSSQANVNSLNEVILNVDATTLSNARLSFDQREFDDEDDLMPATFTDSINADGVALSVDGTNWFRLFDLTGFNSTNFYQNKSINLSVFAADNGLTLVSDTQIKFQQFDNGFSTLGTDTGFDRDGFAFDNISITQAIPTVSISPSTLSLEEGNSGTTAFTFNVTLSERSAIPIAVSYSTNDGTATTADNDYVDNDGVLIFNPGDPLTQTITVAVNGDTTFESDETFIARLNGAANANLDSGADQSLGIILSDDGRIINGTNSNDLLTGTPSDDTINGLGGNDLIAGGEGDDTLTGGGDRDRFAIAAGQGTDTITDFSGIGPGANPSQATINEVDTLLFFSNGLTDRLTAENLLLTQNGNDLEITFEGVENTKVILQSFDLEDLDNLETIGNISFDGDLEIQDSFDVININQRLSRVFNRDTVTFLNDLDNRTEGFNQSDDVINGQGGDDNLSGLSGDDLLRGGDGDDRLDGGSDDDILVGNAGNDRLIGGSGSDRFIYTTISGAFDRDTIQDFRKGVDRVQLQFLGVTSINDLNLSIGRGNTIIDLSTQFARPVGSDTITVVGVTNLNNTDFLFG